MTVRRNLHPNPRYIGPDGTSGSVTWTQEDQPSGAPDGGPRTRLVAQNDATGQAVIGNDVGAQVPVTEGETCTIQTRVQSSRFGLPLRMRMNFFNSSGSNIGYTQSAWVPLQTGANGSLISVTATIPAGAVAINVMTVIEHNPGANPVILAGDAISVSMRMVEHTDVLDSYFDGGTPSTELIHNAWDGAVNASTSTQTAADVVATLLTTEQPQPVQVLVSDLPVGVEYQVVGSTLAGRTWSVPGGVGVSDGSQVLLVDTRAPVNAPVQYVLTTGQETLTSNPVEVPWTPEGDVSHRYLIQSLDGQTVVPVRSWQDNGLPRTHPSHTSVFEIHGRRRPVAVLFPAGDGQTTATVLLDRTSGERLDAILGEGGAVCVRTDGQVRDMAPSDIAVVMDPSSELWGGDGGLSTSRLWNLPLTWIDDPEPGTVPTVWTWGDVDTLLGGMTWGEVDAEFAGMTFGEFDATDWGQF